MKKLEIKTEKATLLVVDLPECKTHLIYKGYYVMDSSDKGLNNKCRKISQGDTQGFYYIGTDFKYLGKVSEITEEEWADIVDLPIEHKIDSYNPLLIKRYFRFKDYQSDANILKTSIESGFSLLKANGIILENKYQDDWDELCIWGHGDFSKDGKSSFELYTEEQEKVWSNPHVFIKV